MAATDKQYRSQYALDVVFAITSLLMLVSIILMLVQDYNREFKTEQRRFRDVEAAVAQRMALEQIPSEAELTQAEAKVQQAKSARDAQQDKIGELRREIEN